MASVHTPGSKSPRVTAVFGDGFESFPLKTGATFADLATKISTIGAEHDGAPVDIRVKFCGQPSLVPIAPVHKNSKLNF